MGFHDTWLDQWINAEDTPQQDVVNYKNQIIQQEYEAALQRKRENIGVKDEDKYENIDT